MSSRSITLLFVVAGFGALTTLALMDVGYFGIIEPHFRSWGEAQVLADLVILAVLACIWMSNDARDRALPAWPFILITVVAGSFGPLLYLLVRELSAPASQSARTATPIRSTS
jgi:hypothetical protein